MNLLGSVQVLRCCVVCYASKPYEINGLLASQVAGENRDRPLVFVVEWGEANWGVRTIAPCVKLLTITINKLYPVDLWRQNMEKVAGRDHCEWHSQVISVWQMTFSEETSGLNSLSWSPWVIGNTWSTFSLFSVASIPSSYGVASKPETSIVRGIYSFKWGLKRFLEQIQWWHRVPAMTTKREVQCT